jgi:hypothetical protein
MTQEQILLLGALVLIGMSFVWKVRNFHKKTRKSEKGERKKCQLNWSLS